LENKMKTITWLIITMVLGVITAVDYVVPDFLPFIDEFLLTIITISSTYKTIKSLF